jgi:hypothetical protein
MKQGSVYEHADQWRKVIDSSGPDFQETVLYRAVLPLVEFVERVQPPLSWGHRLHILLYGKLPLELTGSKNG